MSEVSIVGDVGKAAAELFVEATAGAVAARGRAVVALTGGSSAPPLYSALLDAPWRNKIPWDSMHFFTGDERAVPPSDPLSNWGAAARDLFAHLSLRDSQLHRMRGEAPDLDAEAARVARELHQIAGEPPRLDLLLLGLGHDGHLFSLFAGVKTSTERGDAELVRHVAAPREVEPHVARLTMTPFLLITARTVVVQVTGAGKAEALARALKGPEDLLGCPAQWLRRASGRVVVVSDAAAAAGL